MRRLMCCLMSVGIVMLFGTAAFAVELQDNFDSIICNYFNVTQAEVDDVREAGLSSDEIPVAFHIAQRGGISVQRVAQMKTRGDSWTGIVLGRNMGLEVFYIMISGEINSSIYSPIIAKYNAVPQSRWNQMQLSDSEIADLVNLKMMASGHDYNIFKIIAMRDLNKSFEQINHEVR